MASELTGKKIAFLATDGVERIELESPRRAVSEAGGEVMLITIDELDVKIFEHDEGPKMKERADALVTDVTVADFDALVLPGGVANPDKLRADEGAVAFARSFFEAGKPVAAICHGPWLLVEADVVRGRRLTSFPSIKTDLQNAGAEWADEEVVDDGGLVTSRSPDDLEAFNAKIIEAIASGSPAARA